MASFITNSLTGNGGFTKHGAGVSKQYERVLGYATIPAVLVEVGFGDNAADLQLLNGKRNEIADSFLEGINNYYNSK